MKKIILIIMMLFIGVAKGQSPILGLFVADAPKDTLFENPSWADGRTVYYISTTYGKDSYDGLTSRTPWKTLNKVNTHGQQDSNVYLFRRGDTFTNKTELNDSISYALAINNGVTNLYFGSYGGGAKPIIDGGGLGGSRYSFYYNWDAITTGTTNFKNLCFFNPDSSSEKYQALYGGDNEFANYETMCFAAWSLGRVVIDSCTFDGDRKSYSNMYVSNQFADSLPYTITNSLYKNSYAEHGVYMTNVVNPVLENNIFQNLAESGIKIGDSRNITIRYNYFESVAVGGSVFDIDTLDWSYNVIRYDSISGGTEDVYYPDTVLSLVTYGLFFNGENNAVEVYNNTFAIDYYSKSFIGVNSPSGTSGDISVYNNIFWVRDGTDVDGTSGKYFFRKDSADVLWLSDHNIFYVPDTTEFSGTHGYMWHEHDAGNYFYNLTEWQNGTGNDVNSTYRDSDDTLFVSGTNRDYTLFAASPAINSGKYNKGNMLPASYKNIANWGQSGATNDRYSATITASNYIFINNASYPVPNVSADGSEYELSYTVSCTIADDTVKSYMGNITDEIANGEARRGLTTTPTVIKHIISESEGTKYIYIQGDGDAGTITVNNPAIRSLPLPTIVDYLSNPLVGLPDIGAYEKQD